MEIFKESHTTKVIKEAYRDGHLSVCRYGSNYLVTNGAYIIEIPAHLTKIKAALMGLGCLPEANEERTAGPGCVPTDSVIKTWEQIRDAELIPADPAPSPWLYKVQDNIYNIITTRQGAFAVWDHYMRMFAMQYEGIAVTPKVKALRYMYGCILPCRIEFTPFPELYGPEEEAGCGDA